ncbi:MAG: helix-turn-helix domain-containing protein [Oscillospiraceae bacterium]|nr:helix-turn-helix domain-containing protein [Oscillospiraceae bacterium]
MSTERNSFSVRLEELLKARRMTQKELAEKAEVTEAAMSHYIKGDRTPRSSVLARIAMALGTTSEYLMEGVPQSYVDEIGYAKRLIARNVDQMTAAEKREILSILLGDREG